jgi:hypothetical protein
MQSKERWISNYGEIPDCLCDDNVVRVVLRCGHHHTAEAADIDWQLGGNGEFDDSTDVVAWQYEEEE